jgi:3-oxoacyl-[acyl-carrier-protein] synthase II
MEPAHRDVVITGLGAVCAVGKDCPSLWKAVEEGRCGISEIWRFSTDGFRVHTGALVDGPVDPSLSGRSLSEALCCLFADAAAREALHDARLDSNDLDGLRLAFLFGTGLVGERPVHCLTERIADALGLDGPRLTVSTACSSSTNAIGLGRDLLSMDVADVVLAGGADVLTPEVFAGFHALGVLSPTKCAPFSIPFGTTLGEGAGFLVLERAQLAYRRNANVFAVLSGCGMSGDGWHETSPDPKGSGVQRAIQGALCDATLAADAIGYVNAHGSGTQANDLSEWLGVQVALGHRASDIPVSSTKGALGHAQGAAGVLEAIVTLMGMRRDVIPPTLNFSSPRHNAPSDPVPTTAPRPGRWEHALTLNSAFGGSNAALVLSRPGATLRPRARRQVIARGVGFVGPGGAEKGILWDLRSPNAAGRMRPIAMNELVPTADPRGLDPASRYLTAAASLALRDAGVQVRGSLRDRTGLFVGQLRGSAASLVAFERSIEERGLAALSPAAFARIVLNAAAGFCSKLLSLRGPLCAITTGEGSGLVALIMAAELLSTRSDVDFMLAGACDENGGDAAGVATPNGDGAASVVLGAAHATAAHHDHGVVLAGWALAPPGQVDEALTRATLGDPALLSGPVFRAEDAPGGAATRGIAALIHALDALDHGETDRALVTVDTSHSLSAAVVLTRGRGLS